VKLLKIGVASHVGKRFESLEGGSPVPLTLIGAINGGPNVEAWCHYHCIEHRAHHEWFHWNPSTLAFVELLLGHSADVASFMCPAHWRADQQRAAKGLKNSGWGASERMGHLPARPNRTASYVESKKRRAGEIQSCGCAACRCFHGGRS
jgi:hypothetical protein